MSSAETIEEVPDIDGDNPPRLTRALVGHHSQQENFLSALNGQRMPHAWLLTGPKGVGKASFAYLAARAVLTGGPIDALSPALENSEAHLVEEGSHPDLFILKREYNQKTQKFRGDIPVDAARDMKQSFNLSAGRGGWRVAIIDSIDDMNKNGVNALLKLIEEPPEKCLFLIVCHNPGRVLDTIRSRCRMLAFNALNETNLRQIVHGRLESSDPNEVAASAFWRRAVPVMHLCCAPRAVLTCIAIWSGCWKPRRSLMLRSCTRWPDALGRAPRLSNSVFSAFCLRAGYIAMSAVPQSVLIFSRYLKANWRW
jgi:DNA polymerase III delta' subunit